MTNLRLSVIVSTRNRPDDVAPCLESILANAEAAFEVVVVDQSDGDETRQVLQRFAHDSRVRYERTATRGLSVSRNVGLSVAQAPIVAFTDDDCRVRSDWVGNILAIFDESSEAAVIFGRVEVPEGHGGHAAAFEPPCRVIQHRLPAVDVPWGIGANMAFRRSVFERVGSFDPLLGAGARFPAGEETDLMIRALAAGMRVVNAREVTVLHLGVREGADASRLMRGYGFGLGAALTKHVRLRTKDATWLLTAWVAHHGRRSLENLAFGRRPTGLGFVTSFLSGAYHSREQPVDKAAAVYVARS